MAALAVPVVKMRQARYARDANIEREVDIGNNRMSRRRSLFLIGMRSKVSPMLISGVSDINWTRYLVQSILEVLKKIESARCWSLIPSQ